MCLTGHVWPHEVRSQPLRAPASIPSLPADRRSGLAEGQADAAPPTTSSSYMQAAGITGVPPDAAARSSRSQRITEVRAGVLFAYVHVRPLFAWCIAALSCSARIASWEWYARWQSCQRHVLAAL